MIDDFTPARVRQRSKIKQVAPLAKVPVRPLHEQAAVEDVSFRTPDEVADLAGPEANSSVAGRHRPDNRSWYAFSWPLSRRQQIIASLAVVLLAFGSGAAWTLTHHRRAVVADTTSKHAARPKKKAAAPIYSTLSGLSIADTSANQRPVTGVMIENSLDARPQSGLSQAGVVFEAVAEGGVTRFLALFQDQVPANVGPIRSARPYYVQWDMGFDAPYAHVGGSPDALADITQWGTKDLNQFYNGGSYHRISSRAAPHNVYTGIDTLNQLETAKGYTGSNYSGFARKADTAGKQPTAASLDFGLSGYTYDPHYDYDAASNSYKRSEAGEPQLDANTGAQLNPKIVIAIVVPLVQGELDSSGAYYSNYNVIGSGQAYVFQDGAVTTGTWTKTSSTDQITFADSTGKPLALNRGQTWISAVSDAAKVSYK